jgi:hypothetical protein
VCRLPAREIALVEGVSRLGFGPRSVAARFNSLTRRDITGHMTKCVSEEKEE